MTESATRWHSPDERLRGLCDLREELPTMPELARESLGELTWLSRDCPVCGRAGKTVLFRDRNRREGYAIETDLVRCLYCGMRYLDPVPSSDDWQSAYSNIHTLSRERRKRAAGRAVKAMDRAIGVWVRLWSPAIDWHTEPRSDGHGLRLLDVGCGTGRKLVAYQQRGFEVYGIDLAQEAIAQAQDWVPEGHFQVGPFEASHYPEGSFDVVRFDSVLEHIYDPRAFLVRVHALLRPGGTAFGFVPNGIGPSVIALGRYSISSWVPFHLNLFTPRCLHSLAQSVGFDSRVLQAPRPEWAVLSAKQWANRRRASFDEKARGWWERALFVPLAPMWWLLAKVWQGEELILVATR